MKQLDPLIHKHECFSTGQMEPGVFRCIHCGIWNKEINPDLENKKRIEALERERDHNLDSINVGNAIINKQRERIAELEAALDVALEALESSRVFVTTREKTKHPEGTEWYDEVIAKLKEMRPTPQKEADQRAWEWQNQHHIRRQFEDDDFQPGAI